MSWKIFYILTLQDPPVPAKQYFEEVTSSIVEVMSQDEVSGLGKAYQESTQCLSSEQGHHTGDQEEGNPRTELKLYPDYVTLNRESLIICSTGNKYVYEQLGEMRVPGVEGALLPNTCHRFCVSDCLETNFLNHSYVPLSKPAVRAHDKDTGQRGPENLYTNLACS